MLGILLTAILALPAAGQQPGQIIIDRFLGLDDTNPSVSLPNGQAQDLLNVESSLDGTALLKRGGFSRIASLTISTSNVNGATHFVDRSGNNQTVVCHDHYCSKSTNDGAFSVFLTTAGGGTIPKRWSFGSVNGYLYGANDLRDKVFQYDGTTLLYSTAIPQGSILEMTKDRMVVSDVSGVPNGVYYSKSGAYDYFTTGLNSEDAYIDYIGSSGDKVTGLKYSLGMLFIFKNTSITSCILKDQYSSDCGPVSNAIGLTDPASIVEAPGAIYFQGSDKGYWALSQSGLELVSKKIRTFTNSQKVGVSQSNIQDSKADWDAGNMTPASSFNTATTPGLITNSSTTLLDASTNTWNLGTGAGTIYADSQHRLGIPGITSTYTWRYMSLNLPTSTATLPTPWTKIHLSGDFGASVGGGTLTMRNVGTGDGYAVLLPNLTYPSVWSLTLTAAAHGLHGTSEATLCLSNSGTTYNCSDELIEWSSTTYSRVTYNCSTPAEIGYLGERPYGWCPSETEDLSGVEFSTYTLIITSTSLLTYRNGDFKAKKYVLSHLSSPSTYKYLQFHGNNSAANPFYLKQVNYSNNVIAVSGYDDISNSTTFYSRVFDTGYSTPTSGPFNSTSTTSGGSGVAFYVRTTTSPNNDLWTSTVQVTNGSIPTLKRYVQYWATMTAAGFMEAPGVTGVSIVAATTGTYRSQCIQPGSGISSWGMFTCSQIPTGNGSLTFYSTSAASCAALPTGPPPTDWTVQPNNAAVAVTANSAYYFAFTSLLGSATDQISADACTVYWNRGAGQPVFGSYDPIKNSIYWTATTSTGTTANRVLKYDLNLNEFYPFSLEAQALQNINNVNYFGSSTGGYWNEFDSGVSDNGSAINAYWKSKDYSGGAPFQGKTFNKVSLVAKNQASGSMTNTYTGSNGLSSSYTISLSTTSTLPYVRSNRNLLNMSPVEFMNFQLGNNSITPFEVDGMAVDFSVSPWVPVNP